MFDPGAADSREVRQESAAVSMRSTGNKRAESSFEGHKKGTVPHKRYKLRCCNGLIHHHMTTDTHHTVAPVP